MTFQIGQKLLQRGVHHAHHLVPNRHPFRVGFHCSLTGTVWTTRKRNRPGEPASRLGAESSIVAINDAIAGGLLLHFMFLEED